MKKNSLVNFMALLTGRKNTNDKLPALINYPKLIRIAEQLSDTYIANSPFPHIVIDDFLEPEVLQQAIAVFPSSSDLNWMSHDVYASNGRPAQVKKLSFPLGTKNVNDEILLPPILRYLLLELNSGAFLYFLRTLTKISGLISDPKMHGGGLHQTLSGGMLRIHADFYKHPLYHLNRRINVLLFLNENWQRSYGGNLELWSPDMSRCEREIEPIANRCVIFNTTETSYHGYTKPISCPANISRKSLAMYYYTTSTTEEKTLASPTHWQDLPEED